jgi:hypothetical protein
MLLIGNFINSNLSYQQEFFPQQTGLPRIQDWD